MIRELLFGKAVTVLFGETRGLRIGIRLVADSWFRLNTWVMISSPVRLGTRPASTGPDCSFASASGTTLTSEPVSIT
ncbi:MAG TPA: hypothetical protein P5076_17715, partial [Myxococcota bacterium]|nr:hypothetical protein [Myxococcota bacterium]